MNEECEQCDECIAHQYCVDYGCNGCICQEESECFSAETIGIHCDECVSHGRCIYLGCTC